MVKTQDPKHCTCFTVLENIDETKQKLEHDGYTPQLAEFNHGQKFGLKKKMDDVTQTHVKVKPNGDIEAENEPSPEYILAHLDDKYSYSAHDEVQDFLNRFNIPYSIKKVADTCIDKIIVKPESPLHWIILAGLILLGAILGWAFIKILR